MLQKIRDQASGPLAYIVVGVIAVVFGVWGIGSYFTPSADPVVASAAGTDITQSELQNAFNQRYQQLRQALGSNFSASEFPESQIRQAALQGLIDEAVTTNYARNAGYRVTNSDVLSFLESVPAFQNNGHFSVQRYKAVLSESNLQPDEYEARVRKALMSNQVQQVVAASAFVAPPEVSALYDQANEQRKIDLVTFDPDAYRKTVSVDPQAVQSYYESHKQEFLRPARVKLAYVSLNANSLPVGPVSSDTLHSLYQQNRDAFGTPEKRSAEAIRVPIQSDSDTAARQTVEKVLNEAKAQKNGASLKALAAESGVAKYESIDSKTQAALPSALGQALFKLDKGQLSDPIKTEKAWYIVRLTGITPAHHPSFNDAVVQNRLKAMAQQNAQIKAFQKKSQTLGDLSYEAPNGLKTISNKLDLPIQTTGWINAQGDNDNKGLGQYKAVRNAAFSDAVLKNHLNSEVIHLGSDREVVLRVIDHQPAAPRPLSDVSDKIHSQLLAAAAQKKAHAAAVAAIAQAKSGTSLETIAKQSPAATFSSPGWIGRSDASVGDAISTAAFAVPLSLAKAGGQTGYQITQTSGQKIALVAVQGQRVAASGNAKQAASQRDQIAQQQQQYNAAAEYAALDDYLQKQADVKIDKKSLRQAQSNEGQGS